MKANKIHIILLAVLTSCSFFNNETEGSKGSVVARVYDAKLYMDDLQAVFPKNVEAKDSAVVARGLINSWAKEELLLLKSELNMPSENKELEKLVQKYRQDLFINSYKKALISQQLDTVVNYEQIEEYYNENKASFKINEELVKFKYIQVAKNSKHKTKLRRLFRSKGKNDLYLLEEEEANLEASFLSDSVWVRYKDVLNKLPVLKAVPRKTVVRPNYYTVRSDNESLYYIYILDVIQRNEIAPLRYMATTVEQMILHKRKLELIKNVEAVLVDDAIKNEQFEIY